MNSTVHDLITAAKGLGILGLLRLLFVWGAKVWPTALGYLRGDKQTALDARRVIVEETKAAAAVHDTEADRIIRAQSTLDAGMSAFMDRLSKRIDDQDSKIDVLEKRLADEVEARKLAGLSAEVAHMRADEIDKRRAQAIVQVAELRQQNNSLTALLADADKTHTMDQKQIQELRLKIDQDNQRILAMEKSLKDFEDGTFEMKRVEKGNEDDV